MKLTRTVALTLGLVLLALVALFLFGGASLLEEEYRSFPSPDGRYRVVVSRKIALRSMMPGQSGDAPGTVKLYDHQGNVLRVAEVEVVHLVDRVEWQADKVLIKLVADWELPK